MILRFNLPGAAKALLGRRDGLAAVEFALVLPFLLTLYFGLFELSRAIDLSRKATLFARSVADLTGQAAGKPVAYPSDANMADIFAGASAILSPFDASGIQVVVSAIGVAGSKGGSVGQVCSSLAFKASRRPDRQATGTNGLPEVPATYRFDGSRYLMVEVTVPYTPVLGQAIYGSLFGDGGLAFTRRLAWAARNGEVVLPPKTSPCRIP